MKTRALVVDDNADMRLLVRKKLQSLSFEVVEADGVRSAIEQIDIHKFNLIVCDYMMPGGSGLELLTYIEMSFEIDSHFILFTHALEQIAESDRERAIAIDKRDMAELVETVRFLQASED